MPSLSTRTALLAAATLAAIAAAASAALFATTAAAQSPNQSPPLGAQSYFLRCWQDGTQILTVREDQALQSLNQPFERGLTLEAADGSRRMLAPMGDSLCVLEFAAARN
jgi:hypothetical protein